MKKSTFTKVLFAFFIVFFLVFIYLRVSPKGKIEMVFSGSLENSSMHHGIVIRNEYVLETNLSGSLRAKVEEGTLVPAGKLIATVINENADKGVQDNLDKINERISEIESSKTIGDNFTDDVFKLDNLISQNIVEMIYYINQGDLKKWNELQKETVALYDKKNKVSNDGAMVDTNLDELNAQKVKLENQLKEYEQNVFSPFPGVFSLNTDGYEKILTTENAKEMKYSDFKNISDKLKEKTSEEMVNDKIKLIDNYEWCVAILLDKDRALDFEIGEQVFLRLNNEKKNINAKVESVSQDKGNNKVMIVSTTSYDANSYIQRSVDVELIKNIYTGLKVPSSALIKKDGQDGVYVSSDGLAKFKKCEVVYKDDNYAIVKENNLDSNSLLLYDEVLTNTSKVYEGKVVR
ncbi:MAG: hypothetical protein E7404_02635 [Ruminococcaceae bacterium]|nr:hypothetical protein [Oscillospiraceae bacterium]